MVNQPPSLNQIIGDYAGFIDCLTAKLQNAGIDNLNQFEMDHICYRVETNEEYKDVYDKLL